jgi:hypothetical protein
MSDKELFDNTIKQQFENYTPTVQPHIWENIVNERKKRRPAGFWFTFFNSRNILLLGALLLVAGGSAYFLTTKYNTTKEIVAVNTQNKLTNNTVTTPVEKNNTAVEKINANQIQNTTTILNNKNFNTAIADNGLLNTSTLVIPSSAKLKIKVRPAPVAMGQDDGDANFTKYRKPSATKNSGDDDFTDIVSNESSLQNNFLQRLLFASADKITIDKQMATLNKKVSPNVVLPDCPEIEKNAAGNKTYFEVYGGPDIAFRSLTDTANSVYLQKRKESSVFSSAFSAGVRYTKVFNNGMSFRTGINYSQINEKFSVVLGNVVQVVYIISANGDTTGSYTTTGTRYKTNINRFKTIDVPLVVGYELGNGRIHANINAGVIINAYSWQKGEVLDSANKPINITTGKNNSPYQFKTNIGLGFLGGVSVYYKLNEKIHLMAEPYFRYNLLPMSKENLTLKQKYSTVGLRIGLRVDLK